MATKAKAKKNKSAIKRQKQTAKRTEINRSVKSMLKTLAKKVDQAIAAKNAEVAKDALTKAMKAFDKAAAAGIIHARTASRKVSRLSSRVGKISAA